jgi:hypothetical protein
MEVKARLERGIAIMCAACTLAPALCLALSAELTLLFLPAWLACGRLVGPPVSRRHSQGIMGGQDLQALRYEAAKEAVVARAVVCTYDRHCADCPCVPQQHAERWRKEGGGAAGTGAYCKNGPGQCALLALCPAPSPHPRPPVCAQWCLLPIVHSRWLSPRPIVSSHPLPPTVCVFGTLPIPSRARYRATSAQRSSRCHRPRS